jgi:hypothetical protein
MCIAEGGGTDKKTLSAWKSSLRQAKQSRAVKEYPAVRRATTKTVRTAWPSLSCDASSR